MEDKKIYDLESIIKYFSLTSNIYDEIFIKYMLDKNQAESDNRISSDTATQFLNRFSNEKAFAELVINKIKVNNIPDSRIVKITKISVDCFQRLINGDILPNKIPLKRMLKLLDFLKIPIQKAIDTFWISFNRYNHLQNNTSLGVSSFRRKTARKTFPVVSFQSKERIKRNLETYIIRLVEESEK